MACNLKTLDGFQISPLFLGNIAEKRIMVCSPFEKIILFLSLDVLGACRELEKVLFTVLFTLSSAHFSPLKVKLNKVLYGKAPPGGLNPLPFNIPIFTKMVPLSNT